MTAAVRSTPSLTIPPTQNTAPVLEFRCLYTHDLRRKSKRWQDGFLRFHTFNKRVMVYDVPRNFIGDTHWKEAVDIQEGDELTLDKGVMIEVAEAIGILETDLTPLFHRKEKDSLGGRPSPRPTVQPSMGRAGNPSQLRQKSLNALLGTPKGPYGKAVIPTKSPFEARWDIENRWDGASSPKRQRIAEPQPERTPVRPVQTTRPTFNKDPPLWTRTADARKAPIAKAAPELSKAAPNVPTNHTVKEIIDLDSDLDSVFSDVTLPSTPPGFARPSRPIPGFVPPKNHVPARVQPQQRPTAAPLAAPVPAFASSPPVSISNRIVNVERPVQPATIAKGAPVSPPRNPRAKALRLSKGRGRSTLLCQTTASAKAKTMTKAAPMPLRDVDDDMFSSLDWDSLAADADAATEVARPVKEVQTITEDGGYTSKATGSDSQTGSRDNTTIPPLAPKSVTPVDPPVLKTSAQPPASSPDAFEQMALDHGRMDQRLIVSRPPPPPKRTKTVKPKRPVGPKPAKTPRQSKSKAPRANSKTKTSEASADPDVLSKPTKPAQNRARPVFAKPIEDGVAIGELDAVPIEASPTHRPFRRVRSENDATIPSTAAEREKENATTTSPSYAVSFISQARSTTSAVAAPAPVKAKRKLQRSKSLAVGVVARQNQGPVPREPFLPPAPPVDKDVGPWSTEAFDLFDWRPPGWKDKDGNGVKRGLGMLVE